MLDISVPALTIHQYGLSDNQDVLYLFSAPAKVLAQWAGVPRKGWHIRMLYQRWVTPSRRRELADFWNRAGRPNEALGQSVILGPTAIVLAIQDKSISVENGKLHLRYTPPIDLADDAINNLKRVSDLILPQIRSRLTNTQREALQDFEKEPFAGLLDVEHDYVFQFALQLVQMSADPRWFVDENSVSEDEVREMVTALEALCRPALVVDGQHRLLGAAEADLDVHLPVVAMPHSNWSEQIYQFIVINDKAQKVENSLLTDIFGSSLTQIEQNQIRDKLSRSRIDVEARIAAVIANRDSNSPFFGMVRLKLSNDSTLNQGAFITDTTIRLLIDGSTRHSRGWRIDDELYETLVQPNIPDRVNWDSWTNGSWRTYWFSFWSTVRDFYNEQARKENKPDLWTSSGITNLTKAVTLRILQKLFIDKMIAEVAKVDELRTMLADELEADLVEIRLAAKRKEKIFPADVGAFPSYVRDRFLNFIPLRVFTTTWVKSLDDDQGRADVYSELEKAYDKTKSGKRYVISKSSIYDVKDTKDSDE
jgi:hypothetical protein